MIGEITKEQHAHRRRYETIKARRAKGCTPIYREIQLLPYEFYLPLAWISIALISFVGDLILLAGASRAYQLNQGEEDECQASRVAHLIFDVVATLISLFAIVWFIVFTFYTIKRAPLYYECKEE